MKRASLLLFFFAMTALLCVYPGRVRGFADGQSEITAAEQRIADGFKAKNIGQIMSCYVPDESLVVFDVIPPRQYVGAKAYRKDWEDLFAAFPGPAEAEIHDLSVKADHSLGYAHLVTRSVLTDKNGKKLESMVRTTDVFQKIGGKWLIVHEHNSVPVDLASGKADLLSQP